MFPTFYISPDLYATSPWDVVKDFGHGMRMARHPLYATLLFGTRETRHPQIPTPDEIVKHRLELLQKAYDAKNLHSYVFLHERPWRFEALLDAKAWADDAKWFEVAGDVWVDCEGPGVNATVWHDAVFGSNSPNLYMTMNSDEFVEFKNIKEPLTIYRGANSKVHARTGLSWTTDRDQAIWFARRFSRKTPWLATVTMKRIYVAAVFLRRAEKEIVVVKTPRGVKLEKL